jgi:DNA-binding NarL/FixJ family response regulator
MRSPAPIRVVVADDHRLFRQGLCMLLEKTRQVQVLGEACNGEEAVLLAREQRPDVLLLDVDMPIMDGITAARVLCRRPDAPKIVLLSSFEDDARIRAGMQAGAAGYVPKRVDALELVSILRGILSGHMPVSPFLANQTLEPGGFQDALGRLTERERLVLRLLAEGWSNREISQKAYMSRDTVKVYLKSIFEKLSVRNRTQAAVLAVQAGLPGRSPAVAS